VGFTEWQVILDLTALYSKLREIRPPKVETLQNDPNSAKPNERGTSLIRQIMSALGGACWKLLNDRIMELAACRCLSKPP